MSPGNCPTRETIRAYVAGELTDDEVDEVSSHVLACDRCRSVADELEDDLKAIDDLNTDHDIGGGD